MADDIFTKRVGEAIYSDNYMSTLGVVRRVVDEDGNIVLFLSADNREFVWDWHEGAVKGYGVYVEVRRQNGRWSHGWVDSESRRIVQIG